MTTCRRSRPSRLLWLSTTMEQMIITMNQDNEAMPTEQEAIITKSKIMNSWKIKNQQVPNNNQSHMKGTRWLVLLAGRISFKPMPRKPWLWKRNSENSENKQCTMNLHIKQLFKMEICLIFTRLCLVWDRIVCMLLIMELSIEVRIWGYRSTLRVHKGKASSIKCHQLMLWISYRNLEMNSNGRAI